MDAAYFVIAILGCGDGSAACTPVATMPTHYATQAACSAATGDALLRNADFDFPTLVAECRSAVSPAAAEKPRSPKAPVTLALRG